MGKQDVLFDWFRRIWIDGDLTAIDDYFAPGDAVATGILSDGRIGAEDYRTLVPAIRAQLRGIDGAMTHVIEEGDWLCARYTMRAQSAHSTAGVEAGGLLLMRIEDGKVREAYNNFDFLPFFEQLGLLPPDSLMLLLSGERLG